MACGREPGGSRVDESGPCPAATETRLDGVNGGRNAGRICWVVAGTYCGGMAAGSCTRKYRVCMNCPFFARVEAEEGDAFQLVPDQ